MNSLFKYKLDYLLIILLSFPILFLKLGSFSLRLWDESIYAANSIEMMERGSWIVPYYNGEMDYWNTKPPLINWLQIISMKIFGINEFAIRFPSAIAGLLTILFIYWFIKKYFNSVTGTIASLVLLTTVGFVSFHGARTGDTDVLLTLFVTMSNLLIIDLILQPTQINKKLLLIAAAFCLAFLSKSIVAFLFLPAILIYALIYEVKLIRQLLSNKIFWMSVIGSLSIILGFIFVRNSLQSGYLNSIFTSDLSRVGSTIEQHNEPFNFYLDNLVLHRYSYWIIFLMASLVLLFTKDKNESRAKIIRFTSILSIFYFLLISFSVTKLAWYDIPLFPLLAINIAMVIGVLLERLEVDFKKSLIAILLLFFVPYKHVFGLSQTNYYVEFERKNEVKERFLFQYYHNAPKEIIKGKVQTKMIIYNVGYERSLKFYQEKFKPTQLNLIITDQPELKNGDLFVIEEELIDEKIWPIESLDLIEKFENLNIYKIK